jgi:reverse gyrase
MKIELILSIVGLVLAMSGFNIASAIHSFIKNRIDLIKELNAIRQECKDDTNKLETIARTKINKLMKMLDKIIRAIKNLSTHQQHISEKHNDIAQTVFQIQSYLEKQGFQIKKTSADTINNINPFESLELDFQVTEEGENRS